MTPPLLKPDDKIGIVAPARKISREELLPFTSWCKANSWQPVFGKNLFAENHQFAGTDEQKTEDLNSFLANPEIKAVFCARGGYGAARIVDSVNWELLKTNPKWICGYSDITVFHQHLQNKYTIPSLHCLMPVSFVQHNTEDFWQSADLTAHFLKTGTLSYALPHTFSGISLENCEITGGNFSVIYSLLGSESIAGSQNRILFLEDLDEYLYHIDRMTVALKRSGYFEGVKLIVLGGMTDMRDNTVPFGKTAEEILAEHARSLGIPLVCGFPAGHIAGNFPVPVGWKATIKNNQITFAAP